MEKVTVVAHISTLMLLQSPVPWKSDGKCSEVFGRLWREKVWVSSCFSWSDGRGLLRPALMVDVIRFLLPCQSTTLLFLFRLCCPSYTPHLCVLWEMGKAGWHLVRTPSSTVSVISLNSFGSRLQCLQFPCPKAKDVPGNIPTSVKWLPLNCKTLSSWKGTLGTAVVASCIQGVHKCSCPGQIQAAKVGAQESEWRTVEQVFKGDKLAGVGTVWSYNTT